MASESAAASDGADPVSHHFDRVFVHRHRNKSRIKEAMAIQGKIRAKTSGNWSGSKEIRRWRDLKCS